jgi:hypothetical protein
MLERECVETRTLVPGERARERGGMGARGTKWDTTTVANGTHYMMPVASYAGGSAAPAWATR